MTKTTSRLIAGGAIGLVLVIGILFLNHHSKQEQARRLKEYQQKLDDIEDHFDQKRILKEIELNNQFALEDVQNAKSQEDKDDPIKEADRKIEEHFEWWQKQQERYDQEMEKLRQQQERNQEWLLKDAPRPDESYEDWWRRTQNN